MTVRAQVTRLTLYGRPGCHLCDDAREVLRELGVPFDEIDIESDDELFKRYLERIPVVILDGSVVAELSVDSESLRLLL